MFDLRRVAGGSRRGLTQLVDLFPAFPRVTAVATLAEPGGEAAHHHSKCHGGEKIGEQRPMDSQGGIAGIERVDG